MKFQNFYKILIALPGLLLMSDIIPVAAQTVQITIDASSAAKPVSPYIYGRNNSLSDNSSSPLSLSQWQFLRDAGIMMFRESGGNNSTKYNWRKKLTSHPDWYNNVYRHDWDYAANSLLKNIPGATGMWTLPLIGKTAKTDSANFKDWDYNRSQYWSGVRQNLAGGGTVNTAGGDKALVEGNPNLYLLSWPSDSAVGILTKWFGVNGLGYDKTKLPYWNMDNEPEIWSGTHDDVMPVQLSAEEFMQRYFETAKKARAIFPGIKLVGPVPANEWQWYNWNNDRILYKGQYYCWLEFFIKRIAEEKDATGIKLLDVLDIHFYPGETASSDIVQLHRVYFDRTYVYPGNNGVHRLGSNGWDATINKEYIFGRCQDWLTKYMGADNGVTFSVTETDVNTTDPNVRAVWYASTLGEFARQGVEIFTPWGWGVGMYEVIHLFSKYNQENYINSVSSDETNVSAYPTVNATADSMTIVLVNRSATTTRETQVTLSNFALSGDPVNYYRLNSLSTTESFKSHTVNALKTGAVAPVGNIITVSLPPLSVTSLLLKTKSLSSGLVRKPWDFQGKLKVYPNPANHEFTVSWPLDLKLPFRLDVLNASGLVVQTVALSIPDLQEGQSVLSGDKWPSGIYFIRLSGQNNVLTERVNLLH
jgi:hypothetical protein